MAEVTTREGGGGGIRSFYYFSAIIAAGSLSDNERRGQTPEIKTASLLRRELFVLIVFELSVGTAGSLFPISSLHTSCN